MIIGIGTDITDCRRIEKLIHKYNKKFLDRIFTPSEQLRLSQRNHQANSYSKLFAAKEAVVKALGTGVAQGVLWTDITIERQPWSPPTVKLTGQALHHLQRLSSSGKLPSIHLSMSDEWPYAQAFAIISLSSVLQEVSVLNYKADITTEKESISAPISWSCGPYLTIIRAYKMLKNYFYKKDLKE